MARAHLISVGTLAALAVGLAVIASSACSTPYSAETCSADNPCDDGGTAGSDALSPVVIPAGCDLTKAPNDSPLCIDDGVGIFVAPGGNDAANGAKNAPVKSLARAAELANASGRPRIYACEGTYDAGTELKSPVHVFGGVTCRWTVGGSRPRIAPARDVGLRITGVSGEVIIEDFEVDGTTDPKKSGDSAIAVLVSQSSNVKLVNVTLTALAATDGASAAPRTNYPAGMQAKNGSDGSLFGAATAITCSCSDGTESKGGGGAGGLFGMATSGAAVPAVGASNVGTSAATTCTNGGAGADGIAAGAAAALTSSGALSAAGWDSTIKSSGGPSGHPAQGGGGGGQKTMSGMTSTGGGGACGGCGGAGGAYGGNGGSSFALVSFNSTVVVSGTSTLTSSKAGIGGKGGDGQSGQVGGAGGKGSGTTPCSGGTGGAGAGGSGGGGGGGGHSAAIAYSGVAPSTSGVTLAHGVAGAAGAGGAAGLGGSGMAGPNGNGLPGPVGIAGRADNTLSF